MAEREGFASDLDRKSLILRILAIQMNVPIPQIPGICEQVCYGSLALTLSRA